MPTRVLPISHVRSSRLFWASLLISATLLFSSQLVLAQFSQQGPKLVGTGVVGAVPIYQGYSVALSGDGNTAIVGGPSDNSSVGAAWVFVQPTTVSFSAFSAKLNIYFTPNQYGFALASNFTLGSTSNGINPVTETVTLQIGTFTITIPPGSFQEPSPGDWTFVGVINGVTLAGRDPAHGLPASTFSG
jgi:hypothetical protein